jgi:hypothetical protein
MTPERSRTGLPRAIFVLHDLITGRTGRRETEGETMNEPSQHWTPSSEDDVEGHRLSNNEDESADYRRGNVDDVEGHRQLDEAPAARVRQNDDDDDVEGHRQLARAQQNDDGDDDVEGHRIMG